MSMRIGPPRDEQVSACMSGAERVSAHDLGAQGGCARATGHRVCVLCPEGELTLGHAAQVHGV